MRRTLIVAGLGLALLGVPSVAHADPVDPNPPETSAFPFLPPDDPNPGPAVTGLARQGQTLTADPGGWSGDVELTYQWRRCNATTCGVTGKTGTTYAVTNEDVGLTLKVRVRGETTLGGFHEVDSALTPAVAPLPSAPVATAAPVITGAAREGQTLSASQGFWTGTSPITYSYAWSRCAKACMPTGATGTTYPLTAADAGNRMEVAVTATNEAGSATSVAASVKVAALPKPPEKPVLRRLSPFPVVIITGNLAGRGALITSLAVKTAPRGAVVTVRCEGSSCPFAKTSRRVGRNSRVRLRGLETELRGGTVITILIRKGSVLLGKYARIRIRRDAAPARLDRCLRPGSRRPVRCPAS